MKLLSSIVTGLLLIASAVSAGTLYVNDIMTVTLRSGPGTDHKIIGNVKSGQKLEELESGEEWVRVRLFDGKEGWIFKQVLTKKKPNCIKFEKMNKEYRAYLQKTVPPLQSLEILEDDNLRLGVELSESATRLKTLQDSYDALKKDLAELLKKKERFSQSEARVEELTGKIEKLEEEVLLFQKRQIFRWFFSGAGVLLLGFFLGFNARYQRRKSGLL